MPKVLVKKDSYFRYLLFAGITVFAIFTTAYLISELVSKIYFTNKVPTYKINLKIRAVARKLNEIY